jgi:hypothetical protein
MLDLSALGCCLSFLGVWLGVSLNRAYKKKYDEPATLFLPSLLQCVAIIGMLFNLPGDNAELSSELILAIVGVLVSHALGLWMCAKHAAGQGAERSYMIRALIAQLILPMSSTILLLMILGTIVFGILWEH